ncbi:glycosyltransferase, group 1 family protein, partial [Ancylostoma caninum]
SVLYPSLNTEFFDKTEECSIPEIPTSAEYIFTSLNRFEVKKNIKLAIEAFAYLRTLLSDDEFSKCHLVLAGGYDQLNKENIDYFKELVDYVDFFSLPQKQVTFLRSPSDEEKITLLRRSRAVLYTPHNEHFGIVPVESMYVGTPMLSVWSSSIFERFASSSEANAYIDKKFTFVPCLVSVYSMFTAVREGENFCEGPKESIIHLETGLLAEQLPEAFAECMARLVRDESLVKKLRQMGPKRVRDLFAFEAFSTRLDHLVKGEDS